MKRQAYNPFLPLTEYIPDGEPHVFGDRVYLYGSHDKAWADRFCVRDYTVWSAPVDDLSDWVNHGVSYRKEQDPHSRTGRPVDFYAPDCVRGEDGRYYLYYFAAGPEAKPFGPLSVAVSDDPAGPFSYYGDIRWPDGRAMTMFLTNDPAVLNDGGRIWLYYGWSINRDFRSKPLQPLYHFVESKLFDRPIREIRETKPDICGCACVELESDMLTVKSAPHLVLPSKTIAEKRSPFYTHPFYEAASIRKFGELYYLVYSSGCHNELAYATSRYADRDFRFRGVIISSSDLGLDGNTVMRAPAGTIHGGIERIGGQYYIFYHRCTHTTDFSRQACAEPIDIGPDGAIRQVEITSCGLNRDPLKAEGSYPAAICCQLYDGRPIRLGIKMRGKYPQIVERDGTQVVTDITDGTVIAYKYFDFPEAVKLTVTYRGAAHGTMTAYGVAASITPSEEWQEAEFLLPAQGKAALELRYHGKGKLELKELSFYEDRH